MDYIDSERNYFSNYIEGGAQAMDDYLDGKRLNGAWGDDLEIQAMSEMYERPVEIYAYDNKPMRTFHEASPEEMEKKGQITPFRLSYHGRQHYNSVVPLSWKGQGLITDYKPGEMEDEAIHYAIEAVKEAQS